MTDEAPHPVDLHTADEAMAAWLAAPPFKTLGQIAAERDAGWIHFHPEWYCHQCGHKNLWSWYAMSTAWVQAYPTGSDEIVCPICFAEQHFRETGRVLTWVMQAS